MIEIYKGSAKIHRRQVIHLCECDLNLLIGLFLRKLDQHCKDSGMINKGTYRSRANHRVVDPVIVDVTKTEILMITQIFLVQFNNDATACFDRIMPQNLQVVPPFLSNANRIYGTSWQPSQICKIYNQNS